MNLNETRRQCIFETPLTNSVEGLAHIRCSISQPEPGLTGEIGAGYFISFSMSIWKEQGRSVIAYSFVYC